MRKFTSIAVLAVIGMMRIGLLYGNDAAGAASDANTAADTSTATTSVNTALSNAPNAEKNEKPKKKKITYFDTLSNYIEKVITVNSVNFIKLRSKAGQIFVPNPKIADIDVIDDSSIYLTGLKPGITSVVVQDKKGKLIANYSVRVTYPIDEIKNAVKMLFPDAVLDLVSMDESVIMQGKVGSPEDASEIQAIVEKFIDKKNIINKMEVVTATQVLLKVKIAEVSRTVDQSLGLNWRAISFGDNPNNNKGLWVGESSAVQIANADADAAKTTLMATAAGTDKGAVRWFIQSGAANNISVVLDALATEKFASIVAEPTLIAISGQKATFTSGGEQPYRTKQAGGSSDDYTTSFKEWGTTLEFTPVVLSENRIKITVKPKITSLGTPAADGTPSLSTKEAQTTVELGSGQSLAIAGLLQTSKSSDTGKVPFLSDVPWIGALFKNSKVQNVEKEMVIIVTPYIVKPSSKGLKTPTDAMTKMYSALDVVLKGKSHAAAGKAEGVLSIK